MKIYRGTLLILLATATAVASDNLRMPDARKLKRGDDFKAGLYITALQLYEQLKLQGAIDPNRAPPLCLSANWEEQNHSLEIVMKTDGNFTPGRANLAPATEKLFTQTSTSALNFTYRFLKECGKTKSFSTRLTGYADGIPLSASGKTSYEANLELAQNRADTLAILMRPFLNPEINSTLKSEGFVDPLLIDRKQACTAHRTVTLEILSDLEGIWKLERGKRIIEPEITSAKDMIQTNYQSAATLSALQALKAQDFNMAKVLISLPSECQNNPLLKKELLRLVSNWSDFEKRGLTDTNTLGTLQNYLTMQSEPGAKAEFLPLSPNSAFCFEIDQAFLNLWNSNAIQAIDLGVENSIQIQPKKIQSHGSHSHLGFYCEACGNGARFNESTGDFIIEPRWMTQGDLGTAASPRAFAAYATNQYLLNHTPNGSVESVVDAIARESRKLGGSYFARTQNPMTLLKPEISKTLGRLNHQNSKDDDESGNLRAREWERIVRRVREHRLDPQTLAGIAAFNSGETWKRDLNQLAHQGNHSLLYVNVMKPAGYIVSGKCDSIHENNLLEKLKSGQKIEIKPAPLDYHSDESACLIVPPVAQACSTSPAGDASGGLSETFDKMVSCATQGNSNFLNQYSESERNRIVDSMICGLSNPIQRPTRNAAVDCKK